MAYIGNTVENQGFTPAIDYFNGDGVTVTFTLSRPIASVAQVIVAIDNVIQNPSSSYTVAGSAITFSSAPLSGTNNIWVEYTSLITTYNAISQDPTVIGDIRATGGYLAEGDFGNSFVDGTILDYVTGNGRITVGDADGLTIYNGGTASRTALASWNSSGTLTNTGGAVIQGLTVGKGGGAVATNTAFGLSALGGGSQSGTLNTAVGWSSLISNTTGTANTAFGRASLYNNTTGGEGVALGRSALFSNTTGGQNTAVGSGTLQNNTTASNNTAVGYQAGYSNTTGTELTAIGYKAAYATTGSSNTAIGYNALVSNTSGTGNTGVGSQPLYSNTTGVNNSALGVNSLVLNTTGSYNSAFGQSALYNNTTASGNTAVGYQSLYSTTTGAENTAVGYQAGYGSTGGSSTMVGFQAGYSANTQTICAIGYETLRSSTTGNANTAVGDYRVMYSNTTGANNVAMGRQALYSNTTASNNTAVGYQAGYSQTTGSGGNTHLGYQTGYYVTTGANNTFIGNSCGIAASPTGQVTTGSNIVGIGDNNVANAYIKVAWTVTSDARDKADIQDANYGLSFVNSLRPVVFKWDDRSNYKNWISDGSKKKNKTQIGFLAQDVIALEKENGAIDGDFLIADDNNLDALKLTETKLIPVLVKAIQELNAKVEAQALEIATLKAAK